VVVVSSSSVSYASFAGSPDNQLELGVLAKDIQCKESHILVLRDNGSPACVTQSTSEKLDWDIISKITNTASPEKTSQYDGESIESSGAPQMSRSFPTIEFSKIPTLGESATITLSATFFDFEAEHLPDYSDKISFEMRGFEILSIDPIFANYVTENGISSGTAKVTLTEAQELQYDIVVKAISLNDAGISFTGLFDDFTNTNLVIGETESYVYRDAYRELYNSFGSLKPLRTGESYLGYGTVDNPRTWTIDQLQNEILGTTILSDSYGMAIDLANLTSMQEFIILEWYDSRPEMTNAQIKHDIILTTILPDETIDYLMSKIPLRIITSQDSLVSQSGFDEDPLDSDSIEEVPIEKQIQEYIDYPDPFEGMTLEEITAELAEMGYEGKELEEFAKEIFDELNPKLNVNFFFEQLFPNSYASSHTTFSLRGNIFNSVSQYDTTGKTTVFGLKVCAVDKNLSTGSFKFLKNTNGVTACITTTERGTYALRNIAVSYTHLTLPTKRIV